MPIAFTSQPVSCSFSSNRSAQRCASEQEMLPNIHEIHSSVSRTSRLAIQPKPYCDSFRVAATKKTQQLKLKATKLVLGIFSTFHLLSQKLLTRAFTFYFPYMCMSNKVRSNQDEIKFITGGTRGRRSECTFCWCAGRAHGRPPLKVRCKLHLQCHRTGRAHRNSQSTATQLKQTCFSVVHVLDLYSGNGTSDERRGEKTKDTSD